MYKVTYPKEIWCYHFKRASFTEEREFRNNIFEKEYTRLIKHYDELEYRINKSSISKLANIYADTKFKERIITTGIIRKSVVTSEEEELVIREIEELQETFVKWIS